MYLEGLKVTQTRGFGPIDVVNAYKKEWASKRGRIAANFANLAF